MNVWNRVALYLMSKGSTSKNRNCSDPEVRPASSSHFLNIRVCFSSEGAFLSPEPLKSNPWEIGECWEIQSNVLDRNLDY